MLVFFTSALLLENCSLLRTDIAADKYPRILMVLIHPTFGEQNKNNNAVELFLTI